MPYTLKKITQLIIEGGNDELPPYAPQLNLIEILWRFIKYQWIEIDAYKNWKTFIAFIEKVLKEVGKNYVINFV